MKKKISCDIHKDDFFWVKMEYHSFDAAADDN